MRPQVLSRNERVGKGTMLCSRQESNLHCILRKDASYPLNDESVSSEYWKTYLAATRFARRDFIRAAVFFLMRPRFTALSIAFCAEGRSFASPDFPTAFTASFMIFARRALNTRRRSSTRYAFLADFVFAMARYYTIRPEKQGFSRPRHPEKELIRYTCPYDRVS